MSINPYINSYFSQYNGYVKKKLRKNNYSGLKESERQNHSTKKIASEILKNIDPEIKDHVRLEKAVLLSNDGRIIDINNLDKKALKSIAKNVNQAFFHFSGNCILLSSCFHYNLSNGREVLAAKNTFPHYLGLNEGEVNRIIFGKQRLEVVASGKTSVEELERDLLEHNKTTGQKCYVIDCIGYSLPLIGEVEHRFNAVILSNGSRKYVQFVDAWTTSNHTPTSTKIAKKYKGGRFIAYC